MKFQITRNENCVEAIYSNDEPRVDGFGEHRDDCYRIGASYYTPRERGDCSHAMHFCMQHLKLSNPPYSYASLPGRIVGMTIDEFSQLVDELAKLRDSVKREEP